LKVVLALCAAPCLLSSATPYDQEQEPETAVRQLLERGAYDEAEGRARDVCARIEAQLGPDSLDLARAQDLLVESLLRNGKAGAGSTLALAERVLRIKEDRIGHDDLQVASSLHNLGAVRAERGEFKMAVPLHESGLTIRVRSLGPDAPEVADSLDHLALPLIRLERFDEAGRKLEQSLKIRESVADRSPLGLAQTLELMALLHRNTGTAADAVPLLDRALAIRRQLSPVHPELISALQIRGDALWLGGDIVGAQQTWSEAEALAQKALRSQHPRVAPLLRRLALASDAVGNVAEGRRLREQGLAIAESSMSSCHPEIPSLLSDLALSTAYDGEFVNAWKLYERARARFEQCLGAGHAYIADLVFNEAELAAKMGDLGEAERLQQQAINIWKTSLGEKHPFVARGLDGLAEIVAARGQNVRARSLYESALIIRRAVDPDHPDVAWTLTNLGRIDLRVGNVDAALREVNQAIAIYQGRGGSDEPDHFARVLALRSEIELRRGDSTAARATLADALDIRERIFGKTHPLAAETRAGLASTDFVMGDYGAALSETLEAERDGREHLRYMVRYLPERQSLTYGASRPKGLDLAISFAATDMQAAPRTFDALVKSRALVLDEMAARRRLTSDASAADMGPLWAKLTSARQRLANLVVRGPGDQKPDLYLKLVDDARKEKEEAERALAEKSATFREERKREEIGLDDVRAALPARTALVAFARYDRTLIQPAQAAKPTTGATRAPRTVPSYVAFVLRADRTDVTMVPLGSAATIDRLVASWRHETTGVLRTASAAGAEKVYRTAGAALFQAIWRPIATHVADTAMIFIVPDGTLNLVSFATLPVGQARYLIDSRPIIHYLSAERDVVATAPSARAARGLLAVGGVAFDDASVFSRGRTGSARTRAQVPRGDRLRGGCGDLALLQFPALTATLEEVRDVRSLWTGPPVTVLDGVNASERAFKQSAPGRRVLHLATHGFFLGEQCGPASGAPRAAATSGASSPTRVSPGTADNPLLLSGLALAGANHRADAGPTDEDGILTAEEVTSLNLDGVEWAVLSACDTGLGQVKVGEGVFGLRRAFQVAGVHTVIMSLWSVEDESTREWMTALYDGRLKKKLTTAEAVHRATLTVLRDRRAAGQSTHPFYWGGFVAAGDWR
jgi:CHAT domain-containing protein